MAEKRRMTIKEQPLEPEPEEEPPEKFKEKSWGRWLVEDFLRYWYVIGCFFLDVIVPLELTRNLTGVADVVIPIVALAALVALEVFGYFRLWVTPARARRERAER